MIGAVAKRHGRGAAGEADDLIQEIFMELVKALKSYDPNRPIEAYILEIARRIRISRLRRTSALKRGGPNPSVLAINPHDCYDDVASVSIASNGEDQESALIRAQEGRLLRKALRSISESCREILGLRYEKGLSYKEIAAQLDVKEGTLRVRVQRCLSTLAAEYSSVMIQEAGKT